MNYYLRCAALMVILQLVAAGNAEAAIVKEGIKSSVLARWSLSAVAPCVSIALPCADSLVRAFAEDWTAADGEGWLLVHAESALSIRSFFSPALAVVPNECQTGGGFESAAFGFTQFDNGFDIRLHFASAELVEIVRAESTADYLWLDENVAREYDVGTAACTPSMIGAWKQTEVVVAGPSWIDSPLSVHHDHAISDPHALTLRLLAWLVVLMTVSAQSYNGWPNYATWYVYVWANTCASEYWRDRVAALCEAEGSVASLARNERIRLRLVRELTEWVQEKNPLRDQASLYGDLLRGVIGEVDWMRIADDWLTELEESRRQRALAERVVRV